MYDLSILNNTSNYDYFLKYFSEYSAVDLSVDTRYNYYNAKNDNGLKMIFDKYRPTQIIQGLDEFDASLKLMEWTFNHLIHSGQSDYKGNYFTIDILEFSRIEGVTLNCLCHATVLTEMLLCLGFKARKVFCLSCDVLPNENHVVVEVFISSINKWIMLDPTICCYISDSENNSLSICEIRNALVNNIQLSIRYHNRFKKRNLVISSSMFSEKDYISYLYKDFFRFLVSSLQHSGILEIYDTYYMLVPVGYLKTGLEIHNYIGHQCVAKLTTNSLEFWR